MKPDKSKPQYEQAEELQERIVELLEEIRDLLKAPAP